MSFQITTAMFNASNSVSAGSQSDLTRALTLWQIQTCGGVNVGNPVTALQVVTVNKIQAAICNPESIIGNYSSPGRTVLTAGQQIVIAAGSVHSLAFKVVSGSGTIQLGAEVAQIIEVGESDSWTASRLLDKQFTFVCTAGKIVINTMSEPVILPD